MDRRASSRVPETALRCRDYKEKRETRSERERDNGSPAAAAVATLSATPLSLYSLCRQLVNSFSKQVGEERHARERKFLYTSPLPSRPPAPHYTFHFWSFSFFLFPFSFWVLAEASLFLQRQLSSLVSVELNTWQRVNRLYYATVKWLPSGHSGDQVRPGQFIGIDLTAKMSSALI